MARQRPFNPEVLLPFALAEIQPPLGVGALVWRYLVLVPIEETKLGRATARVADRTDLENLRGALSDHFGGVSALAPLIGSGLREAGKPETMELNVNLPFVVYARPITTSDRYMERLQQELQESLGQGLILVERQEAFLIGQYTAGARPVLASAVAGQLPSEGSPPRLPPSS